MIVILSFGESKLVNFFLNYIFIVGNWTGEAKFKMYFTHGGAIEFGQAMLRAASLGKSLPGLLRQDDTQLLVYLCKLRDLCFYRYSVF